MSNVPRIVLTIFRGIVALLFVVYVITWHSSIGVGLSAGIIVLLLIGVLFSRRIKQRMDDMETKFFDNLNERDLRRSGKKNNVVNDLHLAYMTVGTACEFLGQKLMDSNLRKRFGVNIVSIQRGMSVIPIPSAKERVFPGDVLGVIGTDAQIEAILPLVEAQKPATDLAEPGEFNLRAIMLSESSPLIGKTPITSRLRNDYEVLVVAVQRGEEYIDSDPNLKFRSSDILWVAGSPAALNKIK